MSRPYAEVIGDPIAHSKSPLIHNFWLDQLGVDAEYRACRVPPAELADHLACRPLDAGWRGCNVTIPHKEAVLPFLDQCDDRVRRIGAANTIFPGPAGGLAATNTDVDGVAEAIGGVALAGAAVVVIGAGGAARSALASLEGKGCAAVKVLARTPSKARAAAEDIGLDAEVLPFAAGSGAFEGAGLVINATQLGMMRQEPMPAFVRDELRAMNPAGLVFDMVYAPLETQLLHAARENGLRTSDGLIMLVAQAATAFERFFGRPPPRELDAELRVRLTS